MKTGLWVVTLSAVATLVALPVVSHAGPHGQGGQVGRHDGDGSRQHGKGNNNRRAPQGVNDGDNSRQHGEGYNNRRAPQGVKSGELTKDGDEAHSLRTEQRSDDHQFRKEHKDKN